MGFSRQKYWSGVPFPSPEDLPNPGNELRSPALQADTTIWPPGKPLVRIVLRRNMDNIKGNWTVWLPGDCAPLSATSNCEGDILAIL